VTDKVVDASAVVALLFNEVTRDEVAAALRDCSLYAPSLIAFEVANACLKKMRGLPGERRALLEAFALFDHLSIVPEPIDFAATIALAEQTKLSLYDASYLWI
jgi:predicted nucleic acid-binding protein